MTQRRIDMHTRLLMMEFFWLVFCPLFLLQQTKKKKEKNLREREKCGTWPRQSLSFFANRLASSFLFCGFIGILDTGGPLTLHTFLFDTMNTHITLTLFIYLSIYLRPSTYLCKIITTGMCRSISTF